MEFTACFFIINRMTRTYQHPISPSIEYNYTCVNHRLPSQLRVSSAVPSKAIHFNWHLFQEFIMSPTLLYT